MGRSEPRPDVLIGGHSFKFHIERVGNCELCEWLDTASTFDLYHYVTNQMGDSLFYMQFWNAPWDKEQESRVDRMCQTMVDEGRVRRVSDTPENRAWLRKMLVDFEDEVENQC